MLLNSGLSYNFGILPVPVLERSTLSANARLVLGVLDGFGQNAIFPHLPTIAKRCGWAPTSTKTVLEAVKELVRAGFLEVKPGRGAHAPNYYYLKLPLYCRVEDPALADRLAAVPFAVNTLAWGPAVPGGGVIPAGHVQLSTGQVVPADDVPSLAAQDAAAAGVPLAPDPAALAAQVGAALEMAIAQAVAAAGGSADALALGQRLAALVGATCSMHAPGGAAAGLPLPAAAAQGQAQGARQAGGGGIPAGSAAAAVDAHKKIFLWPEGGAQQPGLFQNDTSTAAPEPSSPAAAAPSAVSADLIRSGNNASVVHEHGMKETDEPNNEREKEPSLLASDLKELPAWQAWARTWASANDNRPWIWTPENLAAAQRITAAAGVDRLAATLAAFSRHRYWSQHGLPLQALAKYAHEYIPAHAPAAAAAPVQACRHDGATCRETFPAAGDSGPAAVVFVTECPCGHRSTSTHTRADLEFSVRTLKSAWAADLLAKLDAAAAAGGQAVARA